jgi:hypothetical protein
MTALWQNATNTIHMIVTCTNRKTRTVPAYLRLAQVRGTSASQRALEWVARLGKEQAGCGVLARDLYAGEHWTIARGLPEYGYTHERVYLWACSAGYGLIPASAPIHPYAATFVTGHADSVPGDPAAWWRTLSEWEGPQPGKPRTIRALTQACPDALFMLMLSPPYLRACHDDIRVAATKVIRPDRFMLISAGTRYPGDLGAIFLPADARLQSCLGGTRQALNVRVGERLLKEGIRSRIDAANYLRDLLEEQPPLTRYDREKLSDEEVMSLIMDGLARSPGASASRLLRAFRDSGYACEQGRFGELHRRLTGSLS